MFFFVIVCFALYFLPTFVGRDKANAGAIFALNFLLGWTVIGWVVALVWATTAEEPPVRTVVHVVQSATALQGTGPYCTHCGGAMNPQARFCQNCGSPVPALVIR